MVESLCRVGPRQREAYLTRVHTSYDGLKKLFPENPLDATYQSTHQHGESRSILPTQISQTSDRWATPDQFRQALDMEREKVTNFYRSKFQELRGTSERLEEEAAAVEDRDLGLDDVIKEEDEDEDGGDEEDGGRAGESDGLLSPQVPVTTSRPPGQARRSMFSRLAPGFGRNRRRTSAVPGPHEADILEATIGSTRGTRSRSTSLGLDQSVSSGYFADDRPRGRIPPPKRGRRSSEMESEDGAGTTDRRTSFSSASSHEHDIGFSRRGVNSLGLVEMDPAGVSSAVSRTSYGEDEEHRVVSESGERPVFIWTANNDYGTVLRIGFKKRISAMWLEAYALKQYVELNLTAFEKILKKCAGPIMLAPLTSSAGTIKTQIPK